MATSSRSLALDRDAWEISDDAVTGLAVLGQTRLASSFDEHAATPSARVNVDGSVRCAPSFSEALGIGPIGDLDSLVALLPVAVGDALRRFVSGDSRESDQSLGRIRLDQVTIDVRARRVDDGVELFAADVSRWMRIIGAQDQLQRRIQSEQDEYRRELATQLHDGPVQLLASVVLEMGLLRRTVDDQTRAQLAGMEQRLSECVTQLRALVESTNATKLSLDELSDALSEVHKRSSALDVANVLTALPDSVNRTALAIALNGLSEAVAAAGAIIDTLDLAAQDDSLMIAVTLSGCHADVVADISRRWENSLVAIHCALRVNGGEMVLLVFGGAITRGDHMPRVR